MTTYTPRRGDQAALTPYLGSGAQLLCSNGTLSPPQTLQLVDPTTPAGVQPVGRSGYGSPVFSDEFGATTLDTLKWATSYPDTAFWKTTTPGGHLTNTGEPQAYHPSGITFPGGSVMRLTLRNQVTVAGLPYTSGMVTSFPSFNPTYGYFEARMKLNDTAFMWPAFWMDPTNTAAWPAECELDIMENFPGGGTNNVVRNTLIWAGSDSPSLVEYSPSGSLELWHTYAAEWRNGRVDWYVDGVKSRPTFTDTGSRVPSTPHYLICNLAGDKDNDPAASSLPQSIDVDYIRAWA